MSEKDEYKVHIDQFDGPMDLLLYVISKSEVDIKDISVSDVTMQYIDYLETMKTLNINVASEYLSMAATLIRLKTKELLPDAEADDIENPEDIISKEQLIEKLLEYKKYKEVASVLKKFEDENIGTFGRGKIEEIEIVPSDEDDEVSGVGVYDLMKAFRNVMERLAQDDDVLSRHVVKMENVRLDDRIEYILGAVEDNEEVLFYNLFEDDPRKIVMVVTFMAILELVKMGEILFRQEQIDGNLFIMKRNEKEVYE